MFSFRRRSPSPEPRRLQIHEYLDLLGCTPVAAPADAQARVLTFAKTIWPKLGLGGWGAHSRDLHHVCRSNTTGALLWHVNADHRDCFLILVTANEATPPYGFILFDIGAQYSVLRFTCPTLGIIDGETNRDTIRDALPRLRGHADPYAILDAGEGTYLQAYATEDGFELEHQLVSTASRYLVECVSEADAVRAFLSYAFGRYEWARDFAWQQMPA